jgi:hypothetical protein
MLVLPGVGLIVAALLAGSGDVPLYAIFQSEAGERAFGQFRTLRPPLVQLVQTTPERIHYLTFDPRAGALTTVTGLMHGGVAHDIPLKSGPLTPRSELGGVAWNGLAFVPDLDATLIAIGTPSGAPHNAIGKLERNGRVSRLFDLSESVTDIDGLAWDPVRRLLYGWDFALKKLYVIDIFEKRVVDVRNGVIQFRFPAVHPIEGQIYAEIPATSSLGIFDPETLDLVTSLGEINGARRLYGLSFAIQPELLEKTHERQTEVEHPVARDRN